MMRHHPTRTRAVRTRGDSDDDEPLPDDVDSGSLIDINEERVRRRQQRIWEFEGDMLTAIENNEDIALQAIYAVYRQRTEDENVAKKSLHTNGRGFNQMNAFR